jgi:hypothetical protein
MFARSFRLPYAQMLRAPRARFRDVSLRGAQGVFWLVSVDRDDTGGWLATVSDFYGCTGQFPCNDVLLRVSEVTRPRR